MKCLMLLECFLQDDMVVEAEFFYFGVNFYHLKSQVQLCRLYDRIPLGYLTSLTSNTEMVTLIKEDIQKLKLCEVGGKNQYQIGVFSKSNINDRIYIYVHRDHAACSNTKFSQIAGVLKIDVEKILLSECTHPPIHHYSLLPYYFNNQVTLKKYKEIAAHAQTKEKIQSDIVQLEQIVEGQVDDAGTPFETPTRRTNEWCEDAWTERLVPGVQKLFPRAKVMNTALLGPSWNMKLLRYLKVQEISQHHNFLFRGAPDVLIGKKNIGVSGLSNHPDPDISDISEDDLLENSLQPNPMMPIQPGFPPEKVGEVFAGLHILLVSKILRNVYKKRDLHRVFKVQGILIDKVNGGVHCILSVQLKEGTSSLNFQVRNCCGQGFLDASCLCSLLHLMLL